MSVVEQMRDEEAGDTGPDDRDFHRLGAAR
jgi:hypothetical protein